MPTPTIPLKADDARLPPEQETAVAHGAFALRPGSCSSRSLRSTDRPTRTGVTDDRAALLPALQILAAFNGAVIGLVGLFAGVLTSDRPLTLVAAAGTVLFGSVWAAGLEATTASDRDSGCTSP